VLVIATNGAASTTREISFQYTANAEL